MQFLLTHHISFSFVMKSVEATQIDGLGRTSKEGDQDNNNKTEFQHFLNKTVSVRFKSNFKVKCYEWPTVGVFLHWEFRPNASFKIKKVFFSNLFLFFILLSSQLKRDSILSWPQGLQSLLFAKSPSFIHVHAQMKSCPVLLNREQLLIVTNDTFFHFKAKERTNVQLVCPFCAKSIAVEEKMEKMALFFFLSFSFFFFISFFFFFFSFFLFRVHLHEL